MNQKNKKIVLIIGAKSYLSSEILDSFKDQNIHLILTTRNKNDKSFFEKKIKNHSFNYFYLDVNKSKSIKNVLKKIKIKFKKIDSLINFAYAGIDGSINRINDEEFKNAINYNIISPFNLAKYSVEIFGSKRLENFSIIFISSIYGIRTPDFSVYKNSSIMNPVHYGTTKASLIHLTKYLANYLARYKIRVNCISPGAFPSKTNSKNKKFIKNLKKKIPLARIGKPEDLTGIIEFLISSKSSYITGQNIIVDGGWTLQWKKKLWL